MPRWVKVSLIVGLIVLVIAGLALAFGGGEHGPGRHFGGGSMDHGGNSTTGSHTWTGTHHGEPRSPSINPEMSGPA